MSDALQLAATPDAAPSGVDSGQVAADPTPATGDATPQDPTEVAFAKRLAAEREKLRAQLEHELRSQHEADLELGAWVREQGYDPREVASALKQYRQTGGDVVTPRAGDEQVQALADRLGITPEAARLLVLQQAEIVEIKTREQERQEDAQFRETYPDLEVKKARQLQQEHAKRGERLSLLTIGRLMKADAARAEGEQATLAAIQARERQQGGPSGAPGHVPGQPDFANMSVEEFRKYREDLRAGRVKFPGT